MDEKRILEYSRKYMDLLKQKEKIRLEMKNLDLEYTDFSIKLVYQIKMKCMEIFKKQNKIKKCRDCKVPLNSENCSDSQLKLKNGRCKDCIAKRNRNRNRKENISIENTINSIKEKYNI